MHESRSIVFPNYFYHATLQMNLGCLSVKPVNFKNINHIIKEHISQELVAHIHTRVTFC